MNFFKLLLNIDRRIIFLIIGALVIVSYFIKISLPISHTKPVKDIYNFLEELPEGSCVLISFDYDPSSEPELTPMARALLRHCFKKKLKVLATALYPQGAALGEEALSSISEEYGAKKEIDYVNLGWKFGTILVILGLGDSITDIYPVDHSDNQTRGMPIFKKVKNYKDIELVITLASTAAPDMWVLYAYTPYKQKIAAGVTAVMAADYYPYLNTGQLVGLINGLKGAAEYESMIGKPDQAIRGMTPQSFVHLTIIFFIIVGNIGYLVTRKKESSARGGFASSGK